MGSRQAGATTTSSPARSGRAGAFVERSLPAEHWIREFGLWVLGSVGRQKWLDRPSYRLEHILTFAFNAFGGSRDRVTNALHGVWLGHPVHPPLASVSTGAIGTTVAFDAISVLPGRPALHLRDASRFTRGALGLGILGNVGAAVTGLADWQHTHVQSRRVGLVHGALNTVAMGLYAMSWWDRGRGRHLRGIAASMLGYGITLGSGYLGGAMVFGSGLGMDHAGERLNLEDWTAVLPLASLPEKQLQRLHVDGAELVLYRTGQQVSAFGAYCPHLGAPMSDGWIDRDRIVCPWHGSRFAVESGTVLRGPATAALPCYQTRLVDGVIELRGGDPNRSVEGEGAAQ